MRRFGRSGASRRRPGGPTSQTILSAGRVELVEQRDAELHHAEAGADVPAGDGAALDQAFADLLRELRQLVALEALQIFGGVDRGRAGS